MKIGQDDALTLAYLTAYWGRVQKMPSLKEVLEEKKKEQPPQTAQSMLEVIKGLNASMGGSVT